MRGENPFKEEKMMELVFLLLLIAVAFTWVFMAGVTERKTGRKSFFFWPLILVYWWGLGKPTQSVHETATTQTTQTELSDNIKKLNETISLLIQKMEEREKKALKKTKEELKQNTNQGE
jgi:apolipoprotein N-acyltransferase